MTFEGFTPAGLAVLAGLEDDNSKAFFEAHRDDYRDGVLEPAKALVIEAGERLRATVAPHLTAEPRVNGSIFRINRDIRFSADKSPYKTQQAVFLWEGSDKKGAPGFYVSVSGHEVAVGAGLMGIGDLDRWRAALDDEAVGTEFEKAVDAALAALPGASTNEPDLKRVPAPYPADHPRGRWLRHKQLRVSQTEPLPDEVTRPAFLDWCVDRWTAVAPVHRWLVDHLS
jgi:uncharacterized protein (TIGR02453 family)